MNQKEFGRRIFERRKYMDMSQAELADKIGVTRQHLSMVEAGDRSCSIEVLALLADVLDENADWFIFGTGHKAPENVLNALQQDTDLNQDEKDTVHNVVVAIKNAKTPSKSKGKRGLFSK